MHESTPGDTPDQHTSTDEDQGPRPLGVAVEPTGHEPVDSQLVRLTEVDHLAVSAHPEVYEDVNRHLRDILTALDQPEGS